MPANIKTPVTDAAVDEYVTQLLAGGPLGKVFPSKPSDCDFTPAQIEKIKKAKAEKRALLKNGKSNVSRTQTPPSTKSPVLLDLPSPKVLTKLTKMLYLQGGMCFFCGQPLKEQDASIEHLNPKSRGGTSTEDNEVVCHKTLNQAFGNMDLKRKFEFLIKVKGAFRCPGT